MVGSARGWRSFAADCGPITPVAAMALFRRNFLSSMSLVIDGLSGAMIRNFSGVRRVTGRGAHPLVQSARLTRIKERV
jgi:hypothetical protein